MPFNQGLEFRQPTNADSIRSARDADTYNARCNAITMAAEDAAINWLASYPVNMWYDFFDFVEDLIKYYWKDGQDAQREKEYDRLLFSQTAYSILKKINLGLWLTVHEGRECNFADRDEVKLHLRQAIPDGIVMRPIKDWVSLERKKWPITNILTEQEIFKRRSDMEPELNAAKYKAKNAWHVSRPIFDRIGNYHPTLTSLMSYYTSGPWRPLTTATSQLITETAPQI